MTPERDFLGAVFLLLCSSSTVFAPRWTFNRMWSRHRARIAEIEAGAPERYFEELRALKAYSPPKRFGVLLVFGWLGFVLGAWQLYQYVMSN